VADSVGFNYSLAEGPTADALLLTPGSREYFADSLASYRVTLALSAPGWVQEHYPTKEQETIDSGTGPISAKWQALFSKQIDFSDRACPIEVNCSWRAGSLQMECSSEGFLLRPRATGKCEHVSFNASLSSRSKLAIIPSLRSKAESRHIIFVTGPGRTFVDVSRRFPDSCQRIILATAKSLTGKQLLFFLVPKLILF